MYWYPLRHIVHVCLNVELLDARCELWFHDGHKAEGNSMKACFFTAFQPEASPRHSLRVFLAEDMDSVRSSCRKAWATSARIQVVERRLLHSADDTPRLSLFMSSERVNLSCFLKKCYDASDVMLQMFINCLRPYCSQNLRLYVCFVGFSKFAAQKLQETLHCIVLLLLDGWNVFKSGSEVLRWMSSAGGRQGLFQ